MAWPRFSPFSDTRRELLSFEPTVQFQVEASGCPVLGNVLLSGTISNSPTRPLRAAHGISGFGDDILGGLGEALFGRPVDFDDFARPAVPPSNGRRVHPQSGVGGSIQADDRWNTVNVNLFGIHSAPTRNINISYRETLIDTCAVTQ
jgi:hypothetical protein